MKSRSIVVLLSSLGALAATATQAQQPRISPKSPPPPASQLAPDELKQVTSLRAQLKPALAARINALAPKDRAELDRRQLAVARAGGRVALAPAFRGTRRISAVTGGRPEDDATMQSLATAGAASAAKTAQFLKCVQSWQPPPPTPKYTPPPPASLPNCNPSASSFNWRVHGYTGPARDQGSCGSCWAFGLIGAYEASFYRNAPALVASKRASVLDASEEDVLSCSGAGTCGGGWVGKAAQWLSKNAVSSEWSVPYSDFKTTTDTAAACSYVPGKSTHRVFSVVATGLDGYKKGTITDKATLKKALCDRGPVAVRMWADDSFSDLADDSVYDANFTGKDGRKTNHVVLLVGWSETKGAWLIRNSWSEGWGDKGYGWVKYGTNNLGYEGAVWVQAGSAPYDIKGPVPPGKATLLWESGMCKLERGMPTIDVNPKKKLIDPVINPGQTPSGKGNIAPNLKGMPGIQK